jgi:hypothetical protein
VVVEVDRMVNNCGMVSLAGKQISVGIPHAGKRVALRIDAGLVQVISDGTVVCTRPSPLTDQQRARLQGARLSGPAAAVPAQVQQVQRVISSSGMVMVAGCKLHAGHAHRGKIVTIALEERMGHDNERAALIYQHKSAAADRKIADGLNKLVQAEQDQGDDDNGAADALVPVA